MQPIIHKLHYHPERDGMVKQFNCTLKTAIHKHAVALDHSGTFTCLVCCLLIGTYPRVTGIQGKRERERERTTGKGTCKIVHSSDSSPVRFTEL